MYSLSLHPPPHPPPLRGQCRMTGKVGQHTQSLERAAGRESGRQCHQGLPAPPRNKGTAAGTGVTAKLQVLGGPGGSNIQSPNDLNWNRRPWGQGTRAENRATAERHSKAQTVLEPGTSVLVNTPGSAQVEPQLGVK